MMDLGTVDCIREEPFAGVGCQRSGKLYRSHSRSDTKFKSTCNDVGQDRNEYDADSHELWSHRPQQNHQSIPTCQPIPSFSSRAPIEALAGVSSKSTFRDQITTSSPPSAILGIRLRNHCRNFQRQVKND
nr:hypothetical protein CFP56_00761 [Quercus suber]